ncbi:hypothetical protein QUA43_05860 [Microcoleus sp. N9_B4]|uniref:hypothetical protein n=1 Tax=Microcoleus sp. N9_B4 TaxID=3055386 RepID=UPI002FD5474A
MHTLSQTTEFILGGCGHLHAIFGEFYQKRRKKEEGRRKKEEGIPYGEKAIKNVRTVGRGCLLYLVASA